jgi:glycosyltransferase involved in cell wall biosynthesis
VKLSVIMPTFNRLALLEQVLQGLVVQSFRDFEVIVAVDGGTDGSIAMLEAFGRRVVGFELQVLSFSHGGRSVARNAAVRAAGGQVLVFVDDDVLLEPDALARHAAFHEVHGVSPGCVAIGPLRFPDGVLRLPQRPGWVNFSGANASVPLRVALEVGLFDESLGGYGGEDLEFGLRLERAGVKFWALPDAGASHLGPRVVGREKAHSAGFQAVMIAQRYGVRVGLQLGVNPVLGLLKRAVLNPLGDVLLGDQPGYVFERAYLQGAREAHRELRARGESVVGDDSEGIAEDHRLDAREKDAREKLDGGT